jgi:hypothetical protein
VHPGRGAIQTPCGLGRRNAHAAEEWTQRNLDARREVCDHLFTIERDDLGAAVRIIVGQETTAGSEAIARKGDVNIDLENVNLEHVAGLGLADVHRPGEDVAAGSLVFHFAIDICVVGGYFGGRNTFAYKTLV